MQSIGHCYEEGIGVEKDYSKAFEWYQKSAKTKNSNSIHAIGKLYAEGKGVRKDYSKMIEYYEKAAQNGDSDSIKKLDALKNKDT